MGHVNRKPLDLAWTSDTRQLAGIQIATGVSAWLDLLAARGAKGLAAPGRERGRDLITRGWTSQLPNSLEARGRLLRQSLTGWDRLRTGTGSTQRVQEREREYLTAPKRAAVVSLAYSRGAGVEWAADRGLTTGLLPAPAVPKGKECQRFLAEEASAFDSFLVSC
jgi:hypothetical protein